MVREKVNLNVPAESENRNVKTVFGVKKLTAKAGRKTVIQELLFNSSIKIGLDVT